MSRILFAAELGGGFGHVRRLLPLARAAAARGFRPLFMVGNPGEAGAFVASAGFEVRAAPSPGRRASSTPRRGDVATTFGDVLAGAGFADRQYLLDATAAWDAELARLRPAAVVCEFSPFLNLALFGSDVPVLVVGHGFILPPPDLAQFPPLLNRAPLYEESKLLDIVSDVCRARARATPAVLPALLAGTSHAVTGLEILDPYRRLRARRAVGPPEIESRFCGAARQSEVFAYLWGAAPSTTAIVRGLVGSGVRGEVFVRGGTPHQRKALTGSAIRWLDRPAPIAAVLERAGVIVHHGSMLTTEEVLVAGKPQLVAPLYLEHLLTARALTELGVANVIRSPQDSRAIRGLVTSALSDGSLAERARIVAEAHGRSSPPDPNLPETLLAAVLPHPLS